MLVLALESSCDETAAAVVQDGRILLSNIISTQKEHQKFGGVVPEIASRKHLELITPIISAALTKAQVGFQNLDAVAVTYGPGLVGALLVGVCTAKSISLAQNIPLIGVNHLEGHLYANFLHKPNLSFPLLALIVSGGHTDLILMREHGVYELIGQTRDDAAGEAFDKIARTLDLGYPGGPIIDQLAQKGNPQAIDFPRAYLDSLDFSFSGLKSSVINYCHKLKQQGKPVPKEDVAASFQAAVIEVLVEKARQAARQHRIESIVLAGGVAANQGLRTALQQMCQQENWQFSCPPVILCTDNAAMIGCAAYYKYLKQDFAPLTLNAIPGLKTGQDLY